MSYTESYYSLSHGTDEKSADEIVSNGFICSGGSSSWCGRGIYFYDIKAKAWWAANRKCREIKDKDGRNVKPALVLADIIDIPKNEIFDLRVKKDLEAFEIFVQPLIEEYKEIVISQVDDETERIIQLRAMLISFYADEQSDKLVIGNFRQRPQPLYEHAIEFANSLDMILGIETIYCVKDGSILTNIRLGGGKR